jgi:hypothetical protein
MQEKKRKKEFASKPKSHSMLQLSLFPALHKQASNQFHLYLQEKRERERACTNDYENGSSKQQIPLTTPFFPPAHSTEEQIPISRREWQEQHTCMHTAKKKMGDQTEKNL